MFTIAYFALIYSAKVPNGSDPISFLILLDIVMCGLIAILVPG